jgi:Spy/CpxP family protein refolding chaperone
MNGNGGMGDMMQMMGGMMQQMGGMMKKDGMAPKPAGGIGGEMAGMDMGRSGGAMPGGAPPAGPMRGMPMPPKPLMQNMPPTMSSGIMEKGGMMGMPPSAAMANSAALPGFPGASHLYHTGANEFFLDHDQHIALTTQQRTALTMAKEKSLMDKASAERGIAQAEQDLWQLTSADQPDAAKIEAKIQEIEKLRGDERMTFIRAIGEAARLLSPEQIKQLLGQLPPAMPQPAAPLAPGKSGGMGPM